VSFPNPTFPICLGYSVFLISLVTSYIENSSTELLNLETILAKYSSWVKTIERQSLKEMGHLKEVK